MAHRSIILAENSSSNTAIMANLSTTAAEISPTDTAVTASLSTTPAEIISMILPWVLPEDLENFAQCCKAVHQQANRKKGDNGLSLLQEHRSLIHKYSVLDDLEDVGPLFRAMSADQSIARYVREINFGFQHRDFYVRSWVTEDLLEDRKIYDLLISAAKAIQMEDHLGDYRSNRREENSQQRMRRTIQLACTEPDLAIALLLPLAQNLNAISFHWRWANTHYDWTKHWIQNIANSSIRIPKKIKEVNVRPDIGCHLPEIVCLTALPSLQKLAVWRPISPHPHDPWSGRRSYPHNTIRHLKLWGSTVKTPMLYDYFNSFENLSSFCFLGGTCGENQPSIRDPMPLFDILLGHSKRTITKLALCTYNGEATTKPPFKQLELLKELYIDWQMLFAQPYIVGEKWEAILPQSLEALTIYDDLSDYKIKNCKPHEIRKRLEPVVEDLISCKKGGLPGIRKFCFAAMFGLCGIGSPDKSYLERMEEVESGFRNRCAPAGLFFSIIRREEMGKFT